jgi:hypothetical protein
VRAVRDLYYRLKHRGTHVFLSYPQLILPEILKKELFLIEMDLPSEEEIVEALWPPRPTPGRCRGTTCTASPPPCAASR